MSELSDTEKMERVNREMKRNQIVARIQDSFGRLEIDALMCRALETLHLANSEIRSRLRDLGNDKYTSSRWQVSPPQADLASRHVLSLIELRLNSWLMVSKCCNEALGEESPEHDDPLYKLIGHHASYAAYIESLRRAMDSNRRMQREPREPGERASRENAKARKPGPTGPGVFNAPQGSKDGNREKTFGVDKTANAPTPNSHESTAPKREREPELKLIRGEANTPRSDEEIERDLLEYEQKMKDWQAGKGDYPTTVPREIYEAYARQFNDMPPYEQFVEEAKVVSKLLKSSQEGTNPTTNA